MTKVITRKEALSLGLKWYFTGKPCKRGHIAEQYTANRACRECKKLGIYGGPKEEVLRNSVVNMWNHAQPITMRQIGDNLRVTKGMVARLLCEARNRGSYVLAIDSRETGRRAAKARLSA